MRIDEGLMRAMEAVTPLRRDEPLARHTTIGIGGPADLYAAPTDTRQVLALLGLCREAGLPYFMLGSGSNIVVGDRGIRGLVIESRASRTELEETRDEEGRPALRLLADAGCSFAAVARQLAFRGVAGLEWACGIPGTFGGAVVYNAGAYGGCLADVLRSVRLWDSQAGETTLTAAELGLVYRGSAFTRGAMQGRVVLGCELRLWPGDETELRARVADYDQRRLKAQPRGRNAGSFFKNPPGQPAWKLLDAAGMRGYQVGGARFSDKHCNFLINVGDATAADVAALKNEAQRRVFEISGVWLENEVTLVGEGFGDD